MTTRVGNAGDYLAVVPMMRRQREHRQEIDPALYALRPDAEQRFRRWIGEMAQDPRSTLLVGEERGKVVGFLYATIERDPPIYVHDEFALIREWWVEPAHRKKGIGKALIERAAFELAANGVEQIRVRTAPADDEVRTLLERCGFRSGVREMVRPLTSVR
jgi:ribosomal protein S18 acetylase RimI-like enzyme